jgi:hypothetical protein
MFKVIIIDRIRKAKSILVAYSCVNSSLDLAVQILIVKKLGSQNEKKGVKSGNK